MIIKRYFYLFLWITQIYSLSVSEGVDASTKGAEPSKEERLKDTIAQLSGESETSRKRSKRKKNKRGQNKYPNRETFVIVSATLLTALGYNAVKSSDTVISPANTTVIYKLLPENPSYVPVDIKDEQLLSSENEQSMNDSFASTSDKEQETETERGTTIIVTPPNNANNLLTDQTIKPLQNNSLHQPSPSHQSIQSILSSGTQTEGGTTAGGPGTYFEVKLPKASAPLADKKSNESSTAVLSGINSPITSDISSGTDTYDADKSEDTDAENKTSKGKKIIGFFNKKKKKNTAENANPNKAKKKKEKKKTSQNNNLNKVKKKIKDYGSDVGNEISQDMKENKKSLKKLMKIHFKKKKKKKKKQPGEASLSEENTVDEQTTDNEEDQVSDNTLADV